MKNINKYYKIKMELKETDFKGVNWIIFCQNTNL
jgi:hypothetical protein